MKNIIMTLMILSASVYASTIGTITALKGKADIKRGKSLLTAHLGDKLQEKDSVITRDSTKVQIIFKDETIITIGKNSNFSIAQYVYEDNNPKPSARFGLVRGAMRTITGKIGKIAPRRFTVKTATTTIGIRGTNFTISGAGSEGQQKVYCTFGAVDVNVLSTGTTVKVPQGTFVAVAVDGSTKLQKYTATNLSDMQSEEFTNKKSKKSTSKQKQTSSSSAPAKKSSSSSSKPAKKSSTSGSKPAKKGSTSGSAPAKKSSTPSTLSNKPKGNSGTSTNGKKNNKNIWTNNKNVTNHDKQNQEEVVRNSTKNIVRYEGGYTGIDYAGSKGARNKPIDGKADMNVNFGNNSATLRIHNAYSTAISVYDMQIKGNDMTGHQVYPNYGASVRGTKTWGNSYTPGFADGVISPDKTNIKGSADVYYYNAKKANVQYNINKEAH
jgi:hypothetical protein